MRKYINIIMGIVMFIVTTALIGCIIYFTNPSFGSIVFVCLASAIGYTMSYLFVTNHLK